MTTRSPSSFSTATTFAPEIRFEKLRERQLPQRLLFDVSKAAVDEEEARCVRVGADEQKPRTVAKIDGETELRKLKDTSDSPPDKRCGQFFANEFERRVVH
ncbi:MAG: hypothetical protein IPK58_25455 [Acidobacteria bacterium]|nr:hypothetical protein [Acidobacteriota bacterium]